MAQQRLDQLARMLQNDITHDRAFTLIGRANDTQYIDQNWWLAKARAQAVQTYLVQRHNIAPEQPFLCQRPIIIRWMRSIQRPGLIGGWRCWQIGIELHELV